MNKIGVSKVGVYCASTPSKLLPDYEIEHAEAVRMVRDGGADFINHGKAIRLRRAILRAGSVECDQRFIEKFAKPKTEEMFNHGA